MMEKEKFIALLTKKWSRTITSKELAMLDGLILENEEYRLISLKLENYFEFKEITNSSPEQLEKVWRKINIREKEGANEKFNYSKPKVTVLTYNHFMKAAALLIIFVSAGILAYKFMQPHTDQALATIATKNVKTFKMLDDGTRIWLNKNSKLSYNTSFGQRKREITLTGEAYFDVVKNSTVPLIIHAGYIDIEVKGTAFNVNAYKGKEKVKVALVRGLLQVTDRLDDKRKLTLHPNQQLTFAAYKNKEEHQFFVSPIQLTKLLNDTRWMADTLVFNREKLKDLVVRMEKKFDLKIEIHSEKLKETRFSGTFINETIHQALAALKLSYPLTYTINNRLVIIKEDK